jgi:pimeloyl-ACP methyl ester carboxylesterase
VKDAAIRTRQLRGYFEGNYGAPGLVYLMGVSEGGNVVMKLVQQNPELFSGALAVSGVVGSAQTEMSYILNERVLFDYFFRGKLRGLAQAGDHIAGLVDTALGNSALAAGPGDTGLPSDGAQFAGLVGQTVGTILALGPTETAALATMKVDGQKMFNWPDEMLGTPDFGTEMTITVATGLWFSIFGTQDMLQRTHGRSPVDTRGSGYWSPVLALIPGAIEALNGESGVERLTSSPAARNYLDNWYQPVGRLRIPLVTLHTSRDPVAPIAQEYRLQGIVQAQARTCLPSSLRTALATSRS